jgi:hypothetical protein
MTVAPKRHFVIGDTQIKPGVPHDAMRWIGRAIVDYKPTTIVHAGDHWDHSSLSSYEAAGSARMEGQRYADDVFSGNEAFKTLCAPMEEEQERLIRNKKTSWRPRKVYLMGNHDVRPDRAAANDAKLIGTVGSDKCDTRDWERIPYLKPIEIDGIFFSHFFPNTHSGKPIGGTIESRLNKIGASFVQGHEQGMRYSNRIMGTQKTQHGLVLGSCYLHREHYRNGADRLWNGCAVLNDVDCGEYDIMTLSLKYLCFKYEGVPLVEFMREKYPNGDWEHLT